MGVEKGRQRDGCCLMMVPPVVLNVQLDTTHVGPVPGEGQVVISGGCVGAVIVQECHVATGGACEREAGGADADGVAAGHEHQRCGADGRQA